MPTTTDADTTLPGGKIEFIEFHAPVLQPDDYTLTVRHTVATTKTDRINERPDSTFTATHAFRVAGERLTLSPKEVVGVFPPSGSLGDHSNVFPHIVLKRSTLPWERPAFSDDETRVRPWLALLVFDERESVDTESVELRTLLTPQTGWPGMDLEPGQKEDDRVTVVRVKKSLLETVMPAPADLAYTAHVRQGTDDDGTPQGDEGAVVMGNRLPRKGSLTTVHLVSLENRFTEDGFSYGGAADSDVVTLVSLHSWRFSCPDEQVYKITPSAIDKLRTREGVPEAVLARLDSLSMQEVHGAKAFLDLLATKLSATDVEAYRDGIFRHSAYRRESFRGLLLGLDREPSTLRLAATRNDDLDSYLSVGATILPHAFRQGGKLMSWYHGPLVPGPIAADLPLPVHSADALLRYDPRVGMLDTSYAAAWELGRLMALRNKAISIPLYHWKRMHAQQLKAAGDRRFVHLPHQSGYTSEETEMPEALQRAFDRLALLHGLPFEYLVPDERMLPRESIRFFYVDPQWISCLLDGAAGIGRVTAEDHRQDSSTMVHGSALRKGPMTGFLLRSDLVAGWPDVQVDGYSEVVAHDHFVPPAECRKILRLDRLSSNVMLCLFKGEVRTLDIHRKPESLHFGVDPRVDGGEGYYKELRNDKGEEESGLIVDPMPWRGDAADRVVDIDALALAIRDKTRVQPFTSAQFALEMIEGVEKVRFRMEENLGQDPAV